jgi:hypothetical protein
MLSFIHYISAMRRLKESEKTVYMLGGPREAPPMVLAQRDMIKHEVEYYKDEAVKLGAYIVIASIFCIAGYTFLSQLGKI